MYGGQTAHLPLKVNTAGTIPPIFASSLLMFPATLAHFKIPGMAAAAVDRSSAATGCSTPSTSLLIVFFCYFYTAVTFQPVDVADNLKKQQAFIPSIRPGKQTADYIDRVLTRITFGGAIYVAVVCVVPSIISAVFHVPFRFGGTSIMIVVGVALDTVEQIEAHLITRNYEGLSGGGGVGARAFAGRRDVLMRLVFVGPPGRERERRRRSSARSSASRRSRRATCSARRRPRASSRRSSSTIDGEGGLVPGRRRHRPHRERIDRADDARTDFLLDGFPRTVPQAEALGALLASAGTKLDVVVAARRARELLMERAVLRRTDETHWTNLPLEV